MKDRAHCAPPLPSDTHDVNRAKIWHFSANWCLIETYFTMTALLASWVKNLEVRDVQVPSSVSELAQNPKVEGALLGSDVRG